MMVTRDWASRGQMTAVTFPPKTIPVAMRVLRRNEEDGGLEMKVKRFTEEQIIRVLKEAESGLKGADLCRQQGISEATYYRWKSKHGGLEVSEAKRLRALEEKNRRLKQLVADKELDLLGLRTALSKSTDASPSAHIGGRRWTR